MNYDEDYYTPFMYITVYTCMGKSHYFTFIDGRVDDVETNSFPTELCEIIAPYTEILTLLESERCCQAIVEIDSNGILTTLTYTISNNDYELSSITTTHGK